MADLFDAPPPEPERYRAKPPMPTVAELQAVFDTAYEMLTATRFPDAVLAKAKLQRLLNVGDPAELAATEKEWRKHQADQDAAAARRAGR